MGHGGFCCRAKTKQLLSAWILQKEPQASGSTSWWVEHGLLSSRVSGWTWNFYAQQNHFLGLGLAFVVAQFDHELNPNPGPSNLQPKDPNQASVRWEAWRWVTVLSCYLVSPWRPNYRRVEKNSPRNVDQTAVLCQTKYGTRMYTIS